MKIFISWSGPLSRAVAEALRDWLPSVLQYAEPYVSSQDINKGARWSVEIGRELDATDFGIICVTPSNLEKPWLNFEAGALAKSFEEGHISPLLFGVEHLLGGGPLSQFQATAYTRGEIHALARSINAYATVPLSDQLLDRVFGQMWPSLQEALDPFLAAAVAEGESAEHGNDAKLNELLELARAQAKASAVPARAAAPAAPLKLVTPGVVDANEVMFLLARLGASTRSIPLHVAETPLLVETRARILLLIKALSPLIDTERLESLTLMYEEQDKTTRGLLARPVSHSA
jgi:hypothetical protein